MSAPQAASTAQVGGSHPEWAGVWMSNAYPLSHGLLVTVELVGRLAIRRCSSPCGRILAAAACLGHEAVAARAVMDDDHLLVQDDVHHLVQDDVHVLGLCHPVAAWA